jgi:hypothetical protein
LIAAPQEDLRVHPLSPAAAAASAAAVPDMQFPLFVTLTRSGDLRLALAQLCSRECLTSWQRVHRHAGAHRSEEVRCRASAWHFGRNPPPAASPITRARARSATADLASSKPRNCRSSAFRYLCCTTLSRVRLPRSAALFLPRYTAMPGAMTSVFLCLSCR